MGKCILETKKILTQVYRNHWIITPCIHHKTLTKKTKINWEVNSSHYFSTYQKLAMQIKPCKLNDSKLFPHMHDIMYMSEPIQYISKKILQKNLEQQPEYQIKKPESLKSFSVLGKVYQAYMCNRKTQD